MPELPEVETLIRALRHDLRGARFGRVRVARRDVIHGDPRPPERLLPRRLVRSVGRIGKRIEIELSGGLRFFTHLGMTGSLGVWPRDEPAARHTHLIIDLQGQSAQLRFGDARRFGGIWLFDGGELSVGKPLPAVGCDILSANLACFGRILGAKRAIKALLLDQHALAGLGNIYCDEALFEACIHPLRKASTLSADEIGRLWRAVGRILRAAIRAKGSTIRDYRGPGGAPGRFQRAHRVYARDGLPCTRCGAELIRLIVAGRGTTACPACQPMGSTGPSRRRRKTR